MGHPMEVVDLHESTQTALMHAGIAAQATQGFLEEEAAKTVLSRMMQHAESQLRSKTVDAMLPEELRGHELMWRMGCAASVALLGDCTRNCEHEVCFYGIRLSTPHL